MKNFVVYKAGAGSGKTFTLVKEYLRLALADPEKLGQNYRHILAVTFTNKAAAEMKSRVVQALDRISAAGQPGDAMAAQLCTELSVSKEELQRRALTVLTHLLHHYSDFSIGTIDSFTHRIVRTFAQELNLPVNFNVEPDAAGFYEKVISLLLSRVGEDPDISRLLKEFVLTRTADNSSWDPEQGIREFTSLLLQENAKAHLEKLSALPANRLEELHSEFNTFIAEYRQHLKIHAQKAIDLIASRHLTDDDFIYKKSGPQSFFAKCLKAEATPEDASGKRLTDALENNRWLSAPADTTLADDLNSYARILISYIEKNYSRYTLCNLLSKQMHILLLLRKIDEISREQKEEERIVFISEFNTRIYELINSEPAPFIYERLGERYHHFLLDEFQDTSSLQWLNLLPLLDNSLAAGWYNLVVGDGKQSIYRWRNANVRQFAILPELEAGDNPVQQERARSLLRNYEPRTLGVNFRSAATLVDFNNSLFAELAGIAEGENMRIYHRHAQTADSSEEGYITLNCGVVESGELEPLNIGLTLQYIRQAIEDGFRYRDICVLSRKNVHGNVIAASLVENDIPVVSSDSLLLKNNLEVNTVISFLRAELNPRDHVNAAAVITYLHTSGLIGSEKLDELLKRLSQGTPLRVILPEVTGQATAIDGAASLAEHCLQIITSLKLEKRAGQYIRFLLDEVHEFMVTRGPGIGPFLEWWETRASHASLILPADTDAVRIMTIHASKGLEFPVVILPYFNWPVYRQGDAWVNVLHENIGLPVGVVRLGKKAGESGFAEEVSNEQREQVLDNVNLLYVALTRAASRMHLICNRSKGNNSQMAGDWIVAYAEKNLTENSGGLYIVGSRKRNMGKVGDAEVKLMKLQDLSFEDSMSAVKLKQGTASANPSAAHGLLLHEMLSRIRVSDDVEKVIEAYHTSGMVPPESVDGYRSALNSIIAHPELKAYFGKDIRSRNETEIMTAEGELLRPDKVTFMADHVAIIDYKSGAEKTRQHAEQLLKYERALRQMGHSRIKKLVVYIDENRVVELN